MRATLGDTATTVLREIGLFGGLSDEVLRQFGGELEVRELGPGTTVFCELETGREMFVILDGEVEITKKSRNQIEARVALFGPNDWFGEMSILDVMPRSATARTVAPSRLLRLSSHDLEGLYRRDVKSYSLVILNIAREMSRRLRIADGLLADLVANVNEASALRRSEGP